MPTKKEKKPTKSAAKPKKEVVEEIIPENAITSATDLGLKFEKVNLRDLNDIYVAITSQTFTLDSKEYAGKEYYLVMLNDGQLFAVQKTFFKIIAQIMPT